MASAISDLAGDARQLLLEPRSEFQHERLASFQAHGATPVAALPADFFLIT